MSKITQPIRETLNISPLTALQKSATPVEHVCECGQPLETLPPVPFIPGVRYGTRCAACRDKRIAAKQKKDLRLRRHTKQIKIIEELDRVIPKLFRRARISHLPSQLKSKINMTMLDGTRGLFLYGRPGTGKSYAINAVARQLIASGQSVQRVVWDRFTLDVKDTYAKTGISESSIIQPLINCRVLFLEDIGTSTSGKAVESDFCLRLLLTILDSRLEALKPTWITSNKNFEQIGQTFDERVASRLEGFCEPILLSGCDRRKSEPKPVLTLRKSG